MSEIKADSQPAPKGFTAWSFSRYNGYVKCPAAAKYRNIDRLPEPDSPAMSRGSSVHEAIAEYIAKDGHMTEEMVHFMSLLDRLRAGYRDEDVIVEDDWAFRADWSVTKWDDWKGCRVRMKVDCAELTGNTLNLFDWKTGKFSPQWNVHEYTMQLELYALGALVMFGESVPRIVVEPRLIYLDHGIVYPEQPVRFTMKDMPRLKNIWEDRAKPMLADRIFAPNPGRICSWCAFAKAKGGPCAHG
jgi:hypothetical protein